MNNVFKDSNVLVTGGAGFIGSEAVKQLLSKGAFVTVLDNFSSGKRKYLPKNKNLKIIKGDIQDENTTKKAVKDKNFVLHLAALPFIPDSYYHPIDFFKVDTIGTVNMLWSSVNSRSVENFVHISTSEVYGTAQHSPMDENHPTAPHSTYAVSKLAGDRAAFTLHKENGFPVVIIRPFNAFGPRYTEPYIIPEIMNQLLSGKRELTLGNVNSSRDFTFVSDSVNGFLLAMTEKKAEGEIINIGSGTDVRILDLVKKIAKVSKFKVKIKFDESRLRPYDVDRLICDNRKAKKLLGWKPQVSVEDGLKITWDWAKKNKVSFDAPFKRWYFKNDSKKSKTKK
jgi:nucleoside-diphosphate-sugar epimerase